MYIYTHTYVYIYIYIHVYTYTYIALAPKWTRRAKDVDVRPISLLTLWISEGLTQA